MGSMAGVAMLGIAGLLGVVAGGVLAYLAERLPTQTELLETAAGILVLGGFALAGYAMPPII
jgi:hypothetical protein